MRWLNMLYAATSFQTVIVVKEVGELREEKKTMQYYCMDTSRLDMPRFHFCHQRYAIVVYLLFFLPLHRSM